MDQMRAIKRGDKRAAAKLITMVENNDPAAVEMLEHSLASSTEARVIGITGSPGAGKSTLTDQLAKHLLKSKKKVGIIAVDPSSPITGGAFLGDRIRMSDLNAEPDVFIRSMATRGALGGVAKAVSGAVRVMELYGADYIFVETVGIGQSEIDVAAMVDTVVLVVVPGMGDDIQAEKAGILEVADVIAVNKADHADTDKTIQQLKAMMGLQLGHQQEAGANDFSRIDIISTIATAGTGIADLMQSVETHLTQQIQGERLSDSVEKRLKAELLNLVYGKLESEFISFDQETHVLSESMGKILEKKSEPYTESRILLEKFMKWRSLKC